MMTYCHFISEGNINASTDEWAIDGTVVYSCQLCGVLVADRFNKDIHQGWHDANDKVEP